MLIRVKREGGKGHRLIDKAKYDLNPSEYEVLGAAPPTPGYAKASTGLFQVVPAENEEGFFVVMSDEIVMVDGLVQEDVDQFNAMTNKQKSAYVRKHSK